MKGWMLRDGDTWYTLGHGWLSGEAGRDKAHVFRNLDRIEKLHKQYRRSPYPHDTSGWIVETVELEPFGATRAQEMFK